jgi:hypothetical protein
MFLFLDNDLFPALKYSLIEDLFFSITENIPDTLPSLPLDTF